MFYHEAALWKHIRHPNIVTFHGVTLDPLQLVSDWMESGDLTEFLKKHPGADRLGIVRVAPAAQLGFQSPHTFTSYKMSPRR